MHEFAKGHGTLNDFVLMTDADGSAEPSAEFVRLLCDRRAGIGGDGYIRAVPARFVPSWTGNGDLWFMDYRNADGSLAEMCGNGLRVFAKYLVGEGLVPPGTTTLAVATRAGLKTATVLPDGRVRLGMGPVRLAAAPATVTVGSRSWAASAVDVGNPHAVVHLGVDESLGQLDLRDAPGFSPELFPHGVNVEFVQPLADLAVAMRVYERGVGETPSCGTGTVAAAAADASRLGLASGTWRVLVPGGEVEVELANGEAWLTGPAVIVARGIVLADGEERSVS